MCRSEATFRFNLSPPRVAGWPAFCFLAQPVVNTAITLDKANNKGASGCERASRGGGQRMVYKKKKEKGSAQKWGQQVLSRCGVGAQQPHYAL